MVLLLHYKNLYSQPLNAVWPVFFPPYGIRKTDEKNPRPSGIPRL